MATLRELKGRIGSVKSSEKITGAMKMISSAKMTKAVRDIKRLLPYRNQLETIIDHLLDSDAAFSSPLAQKRDAKHATLIVAGSDEGLCGAYNANVFKEFAAHVSSVRQQWPDCPVTIIPIGAKMVKIIDKFALSVDYCTVEHAEINSKATDSQVKEFTQTLTARFLASQTDYVSFTYMGFISPSRQRIKIDTLLPISADTSTKRQGVSSQTPYIFEPSASQIYDTIMPMMLLSRVQEGFCENRASEQAARVMAMQSANDNASKLLEQLQLEYNKLRQQSITNELLDILGGQVK